MAAHDLVVLSVLFGVSGLSTLAYLYWDRNPEKAQREAWAVLRFVRRLLWLPPQVVAMTGMFAVYLPLAVAFTVLNSTILGKKTNIKIKIDTEGK